MGYNRFIFFCVIFCIAIALMNDNGDVLLVHLSNEKDTILISISGPVSTKRYVVLSQDRAKNRRCKTRVNIVRSLCSPFH